MAKSFDELVKRTTTKRTRDRAARRTKELLGELLLSEIRKLAGKSQDELAKELGIKQPSLSKLEKQSDMQVSTLRRIIQALGGELEVVARFPKGSVMLEQFRQSTRRSSRQALSFILHDRAPSSGPKPLFPRMTNAEFEGLSGVIARPGPPRRHHPL